MNKKEFMLLLDEICDVDFGTVREGDHLNNTILFDSLAMLGLIAMLDKKFGFSVNMDEIGKIDTVGNLFNKIMSQPKP